MLSAALLHAGWNALLRGGADRLQSMLIMSITLGFTGFFAVAIMLSLLIFIGEAVRDAFDPRKTFR